MKDTFFLTESQPHLTNFAARQITVLNVSGKEVYVRIGGLDQPPRSTAHLIVPALTLFSTAIPDTTQFGFTLSDSVAPSEIGTSPLVTLSDIPEPVAFSSVNLPQTSFRPVFTGISGLAINAGANATIYTMPTGMTKALVFGLWGSVRSTLSTELNVRVQIQQSIFTDLFRFQEGPGTAPMAKTFPPLVLTPQGALFTNIQPANSVRVVNSGAQPIEATVWIWIAPFA